MLLMSKNKYFIYQMFLFLYTEIINLNIFIYLFIFALNKGIKLASILTSGLLRHYKLASTTTLSIPRHPDVQLHPPKLDVGPTLLSCVALPHHSNLMPGGTVDYITSTLGYFKYLSVIYSQSLSFR